MVFAYISWFTLIIKIKVNAMEKVEEKRDIYPIAEKNIIEFGARSKIASFCV